MAFLERLKLRLDTRAPTDGAARPMKLVPPKLRARFTGIMDVMLPYRRARVLYADDDRADAPPDPVKILLPVGGALSDPPLGGDIGDGRAGTLGGQLRYSAGAIVERQGSLAAHARAVRNAIADRLDGSVTMTTWVVRFLIAAAWGALAMQLLAAELFGTPTRIIGLGAVAPENLRSLALVFTIAAGAGMLACFLGAAVVQAAGKGDNKRVRRKAALLGDRAADLALQFDKELDNLRSAMDDRKHAVDAVSDLSRAHLTALEAAVFFRDIQFLTDEEDATLKFRGYLRRHTRAGAGNLEAELRGVMMGSILGAFGIIMLIGPTQLPIELPVLPDFSNAAAELWIVAGGILFLTAGLFIEALRGPLTMGVADSAYDEALDAVRSGFVARKAPRVEDVIRRIEDALDVFKARTSGAGGRSDSALSADDDIPHWRKPPEGPRFVETGFQAAPKSFLGDPKTGRLTGRDEKNIGPATAPKRGLFKLKKP